MMTELEKPRVLVVDDDRTNRMLISKILAQSGYETDVADGGIAALEFIKNHFYEVAVLDYRMPGMNGVELFHEIRKQHPDTIGIFLTGYPTVNTIYPAIEAGVHRVLAKPVDADELLRVVADSTAGSL